MNWKFNLCIFLFLFCFFSSLSAQTIILETFLNQLKQTHPFFEEDRLSSQIEREDRKSLSGIEDWSFFSSITLSRENPEITISEPERTDAVFTEAGVERLFWNTGGRLSASLSTGYAQIEIEPDAADMLGIPESFHQNKIELTYTHPLLKNRKGFLDRLHYELKKYDIDFSEVQSLENQEAFLADAATKYLQWALLTEQVEIVTERLKLSEEELERTERKRVANLVDEVDVIRAENAVCNALQNKVLVESQWKALQSELAVLSQNKKLLDNSPEFDLYTLQDLPSLDQSIEQIKEQSRLLKTIRIRKEQMDLTKKGYEETMKADLSLFTSMNFKNLDEKLGHSLEMDKYDLSVGIQFQIPLEKRTAKSHVNKAKLQIRKLQTLQENLELTLISDLANIYVRIQEMKKILQLNREQIESSQKRTEEELALYNRGCGSLTFVIQSQDAEERTKLLYANNAATCQKLFIQYRALMDEFIK